MKKYDVCASRSNTHTIYKTFENTMYNVENGVMFSKRLSNKFIIRLCVVPVQICISINNQRFHLYVPKDRTAQFNVKMCVLLERVLDHVNVWSEFSLARQHVR